MVSIYTISKSGTFFQDWSTFTQDIDLKYLKKIFLMFLFH